MRLVRLARKRWDVLAVCNSRGECPVTDFLDDLRGTSYLAAVELMVRLLVTQIPINGPPRTEPLCKPLGEGLFEFRRQPKGKKLRVLWFYGGGAIVVCAAAFTKGERTPRTEVERARAHQRRYLEARINGTLEISDT